MTEEQLNIDEIIEAFVKKNIDKLPEEFKPWLENAAKYLKDKSASYINTWFGMLVDYNWADAYAKLVEEMDFQQRAAEQGKIAESLMVLNSANADDIRKQRELIKTLFGLGITIISKEISE